MRIWTRAVILCAAAGGVAVAQPQPQPQPQQLPPPGGDPLTPGGESMPQPPPEPQPQPPPPQPMPPPPPPADPVVTGRPEGSSIGMGFGYAIPGASLENPNTASVRFRLATGVTFEPLVVLQRNARSVDTGTESSDSTLDTSVGTLVRFPLASRRRVDIEGVGSGLIGQSRSDPDGDDNVSSQTTLNLSYGLAIGYWINRNWQVSATATNPFVRYTRIRQEQGVDTVTVQSDTTVGVVWAPEVRFMIHLYY